MLIIGFEPLKWVYKQKMNELLLIVDHTININYWKQKNIYTVERKDGVKKRWVCMYKRVK